MRVFAKFGQAVLLVGVLSGPLVSLLGQEEVTMQRKVEGVPGLPNLLVNPKQERKEPWLGLSISKPLKAAYAQLPKVPRGTGFVVDRVAEGGPVDLAGMVQYDVLWKLDDQLLINEAQFMALLNLRAVGEVVRLTYCRGGEDHEVDATLVGRPESEKGREWADLAVLSPGIPGLPMQVVNVQFQTALLRDGNETVRLQRVGNRYKWVIFDNFGLEMASGELAGSGDDDFPVEVKEERKSKLKALIRSLEQAESRRNRGPRVRRLPSPIEGKS